MKIGKVAAVGLGGSVILLHIASQKGYIDINWDKINKKVDKISDKIEKEATGKSPDWFEKVSFFIVCFILMLGAQTKYKITVFFYCTPYLLFLLLMMGHTYSQHLITFKKYSPLKKKHAVIKLRTFWKHSLEFLRSW